MRYLVPVAEDIVQHVIKWWGVDGFEFPESVSEPQELCDANMLIFDTANDYGITTDDTEFNIELLNDIGAVVDVMLFETAKDMRET